MRVLYSFPLRMGVSGIGHTAWSQVQGLIDAGATVHLVCGSLERPLTGLASCRETMRCLGVKIPYRFLGQTRSLRRHDRLVARMLPGRIEEIDLVHAWPQGARETLTAAHSLGIPTLLERPNSHIRHGCEIVSHEHIRLGLPLPPSNTHSPSPDRIEWEEAEYGLADRLLCPSEYVASSFRARGVQEERICLCQYGCDLECFFPPPVAPNPTDGLRALFVGRCEPRKGLHTALAAWKASGAPGQGTFTIMGEFMPAYRAYLAEALEQPGVHLVPFSSSVDRVMREHNVFLLPSIEEGSALVTYEARASGCVLLVSDATGALCEHDVNALVHRHGDVQHLSEHLERMAHDPALRDRLRLASLATRSDVSWSEAARRLLVVYEDLFMTKGDA